MENLNLELINHEIRKKEVLMSQSLKNKVYFVSKIQGGKFLLILDLDKIKKMKIEEDSILKIKHIKNTINTHEKICEILKGDINEKELISIDNNFWLKSLQNSGFFNINKLDEEILLFCEKISMEIDEGDFLVLIINQDIQNDF
jgi:hypothetical protein